MTNKVLVLALGATLLFSGCKKKAEPAPEAPVQEEVVEDSTAVEATAEEAEAATERNPEAQGLVERWWIADQKTECLQEEEPAPCLRIRRQGRANWEAFAGVIEGFEAEEGVRYILEVDVIGETPLPGSAERLIPSKPSEEEADAADEAAQDAPSEGDEESAPTEVRYVLLRTIVPSSEPEEPSCTSNADCGPDEMCAGPAGCDIPWVCVPARPCTRDYRPFCSCDGETISGSSSCPPGPYLHVGACQ